MDDSQNGQANTMQANMPPMPGDGSMPQGQQLTQTPPSMMDLASMTPPPAPVAPAPVAPAPQPVMQQQPMPAPDLTSMPTVSQGANSAQDDYSYAEDILEEILDSLDRIEAKLDAMEKKQG